jgi:hypothetical protein
MVATPQQSTAPESHLGVLPHDTTFASPVVDGGRGLAPFAVAAVAIGATLRVYPILTSGGFPTGDGGLFLSMVRDLQNHHYVLPAFTSYNHGSIPYAYPPFGLYAAALLQTTSHLSAATVLGLLPPIVTAASLIAFALLARSLLSSQVAVVSAVLAFGLLPDSYFPERMGGGITRSFGLLFALLTLHQLTLLFKRPRRLHLVLATTFATLTVLSHLEWTLFTAYSGLILLWAFGRNRPALLHAGVVTLGSVLLSAPWWLAVAARHGLAPFVATLTNSSSAFPWYGAPAAFLALHWTQEFGFPIVSGLAALGLVACLARRRWLLPAWLLATFTVEARAYVQRPVVVVALLAGIGVEAVLLPLLCRPDLTLAGSRRRIPLLPASVLGFVVLYVLASGTAWDASSTTQLSTADRQAMSWVSTHTPVTARFFVVSVASWGYTNPAEWFPALAKRVNVTTVPGYEWIAGAIGARTPAWNRALVCSSQGAYCIESWLRQNDSVVRYVYVPRGPTPPGQSSSAPAAGLCCRQLRATLTLFHGYELVYNRGGVQIYRRM